VSNDVVEFADEPMAVFGIDVRERSK